MAVNEVTSVDVKTLTPFKRFIMSIGELPTSYLESMTYAEQVMWFCNFLQEKVIPAVNNNADALQDVITYLENLDLQDEVDHKLDEMAEDGTLQEIVADYLNSKAIFGFDTVADMKEATNFIDGSFARTLGYLSINDNGGALYKIRTITNSDVIDEGSIIALADDSLVAELIVDEKVNVLNFGYTVESVTYDGRTSNVKNITTGLNNAISYIIRTETAKGTSGGIIGAQIYFPDDFYYIDEEIDLDDNDIYLHGDSPALKRVDFKMGNFRQKILTNVDGTVFSNGRLYLSGVNFENIINSGNTNTIVFSSAHTRDIKNCVINNYDIVINTNINTVTTINGNFFINCRQKFINGNVVDCVITNNYINAERETGTLTTCFSCGSLSMTTIFNNFIDFFTTTIEGRTQCEELRIENNTFDYTYRAIKLGGVTGGIIANNTFNHISKSYNGTMLHYANGSDPATNDWYAIETAYTIKSLVVNANSIENYDKFITIPHIDLDSSIICSNNTMSDFTKYGSFYKNQKSVNVKIYDLDEKTYTVAPVASNTYIGQKVYYDSGIYRNISDRTICIGLANYEKQTDLSYTATGGGNFNISLEKMNNGALANNSILEIKTTKNYYSLAITQYRIYRIGSTAYAILLFSNATVDFKPSISNTGSTLNIVMTGSYEEGSSSKQVSYVIYEA